MQASEYSAGIHRNTQPRFKGDLKRTDVAVPLPYSSPGLCPVRALRRWMAKAKISQGPVFGRILRRVPRTGGAGAKARAAILVVGTAAIGPRTIARVVQSRAGAAGLDGRRMSGHSLRRGALTTGMDNDVHPIGFKQLGRYKSYSVLDCYLDLGEPFENHALNGIVKGVLRPADRRKTLVA